VSGRRGEVTLGGGRGRRTVPQASLLLHLEGSRGKHETEPLLLSAGVKYRFEVVPQRAQCRKRAAVEKKFTWAGQRPWREKEGWGVERGGGESSK